ncbi:MAG: hypothetical protein DSZ31_03785 [Gammaproteobacteria bacterium]|nr:MAG: hypothetical protein DSZ31_03785 [Gammaproteobacteria bacterium]
MDIVGQFQRWAIFYSGIVWGTLAIIISLSFFFCEFYPSKCEKLVEKVSNCFIFKIFSRKKR